MTTASQKKATSRSKKEKPAENERLNQLEKAMSGLIEMVGTLAETVQKLPETLSQRPHHSVERPQDDGKIEALSQVARPGDMGQSRRVRDLLHPRAPNSGFQPKDVVRVSTESQKYKAFLDTLGSPRVGEILNYMYTKRNGQRKYKCAFPGIGKDSFEERELVLCST